MIKSPAISWPTGVLFLAVALFAVVVLTHGAEAQGPPSPEVSILSPPDEFFTNEELLQVEVHYRAAADPTGRGQAPTGNIHSVVLLIDGIEVGHYANPHKVKEGTHVFSVDISAYPDSIVTLQALAYQGNERARLEGQSDMVMVVIDRTPPEVDAHVTPNANENGWHNTDVSVSFTATDNLSGVAAVSGDVVVTEEGEGQMVTGAATDQAGNSASVSVTINLDKTRPELRITSPADGTTVSEAGLTVVGNVADGLSGLSEVACNGLPAVLNDDAFSCEVTLEEGANDITAAAEDVAGNQATAGITVNLAQGVLLAGEPASPAIEALHDFHTSNGVPDHETSVDDAGAKVARTQLEIAFVKDATLEEVNALLESIDGRIVSMLEGVMITIVRIPDPGSFTRLQAAVADIEASPSVRFVNLEYFSSPADLPSNITTDPVVLHAIRHHLAVRGHGAWNAREALNRPEAAETRIIVADYFGDGAPLSFPEAPLGGTYGTGDPDEHGYHVMGIIGALHGGAESGHGRVTGMHPNALGLRGLDVVVDGTTYLTEAELNNLIIQLVRDSDLNVVVNTSLGFTCGSAANVEAFCNNTQYATQRALTWIEKVRGSDSLFSPNIEGKFLHVTAAGNIHPDAPGVTDAALDSEWAAAKLLEGLESPGLFEPEPVPNLTNILVVEDAVVSLGGPPFNIACLSDGSKYRGDVAAIGTDVWSYLARGATSGAGFLSGTSMAAPQVAGLAAYIWEVDPSLTPQEVIGTIESTARPDLDLSLNHPECNSTVLPAPVIDVYGALLALDQAVAPTPATAPVRLALLYQDEDDDFDDGDLAFFTAVYFEEDGTPVEPVDQDWSRWDLNGDGFTGGSGTERFDLDRVGSTQYGAPLLDTVQQEIAGQEVDLDETALTDRDILCYYAYSDLFSTNQEDQEARDDLLLEHCLPPGMTVLLQSNATQVVAGDPSLGFPTSEGQYLYQAYPEGGAWIAPPVSLEASHGRAEIQLAVEEPSATLLEVSAEASAYDETGTNTTSVKGVAEVRGTIDVTSAGTLTMELLPEWAQLLEGARAAATMRGALSTAPGEFPDILSDNAILLLDANGITSPPEWQTATLEVPTPATVRFFIWEVKAEVKGVPNPSNPADSARAEGSGVAVRMTFAPSHETP